MHKILVSLIILIIISVTGCGTSKNSKKEQVTQVDLSYQDKGYNIFQAKDYNKLSLYYFDKKDYDLACTYSKTSLDYAKKSGDTTSINIATNTLDTTCNRRSQTNTVDSTTIGYMDEGKSSLLDTKGCTLLSEANITALDSINLYNKRYAILKRGSNEPDGPYTISTYTHKILSYKDNLYQFSINQVTLDASSRLDTSEVYVELNNDSRFVNLARQIGCATDAPHAIRLK